MAELHYLTFYMIALSVSLDVLYCKRTANMRNENISIT